MDRFHLDRLDFGLWLERIAAGCHTPRGGVWLIGLRPAAGHPEVVERQTVMGEVGRLGDGEGRLPLEVIPDVDPLLKRLTHAGAMLEPVELWDLLTVLRLVERLAVWFLKGGSGRLPGFCARYGATVRYAPLIADLDGALEDPGQVRDDATPELARVRRRIRGLKERWRRRAGEVAAGWHQQGWAQEAEPVLREGRFVVAVRADQRGRVPGVAIDRSRTGQTFFVEPTELSDLFLELREAEHEEEQELHRILASLSARVAERTDDLDADLDRVAVLDAAHAAMGFAGAGPLHLPEVDPDGDLELHTARHPLLALRLGPERVVPLDLTLPASTRTLVVSGPNSGGKTVMLQTVGLCAALAQCGLPIPADEGSRLPLLGAVLVDIGDEQSIEADLSTFTAHLRRLQTMLTDLPGERLCLIDEAGAGTDPAQGAALAIAVLERLSELGAWTVCTTHNGTIKEYAAAAPSMRNGRMVFSGESLNPTYEFLPGAPGRSFAFEIATRTGLDDRVVARARDLLDPDARRLEEVLLESEERLSELQRQQTAAATERRRAENERRRLERLATEQEAATAGARARAQREAEDLLAESRRRLEATIRELREAQADRPSIEEARRTLRQVGQRLSTLQSAAPPPLISDWAPAEGEPVWVGSLDRQGTVQSTQGRRVRISTQGITLEVDLADLQPVAPGQEQVAAPRRGGAVRSPLKTVPDQLELIGCRAEEARDRLEKYLDDALLAGKSQVRIVHGVGAGVLRRVVDEVLREHPEVVEHGLDRGNPGGIGVTLVRLRGGDQ